MPRHDALSPRIPVLAGLRVVAGATLLAMTAASCAPDPGSGGPTTTVPPVPPEPFTIVFVADPEARMRGNTNAEVSGYVSELVSLTTTEERFFAHDGGRHRIDPELVIVGGDISADRGTSIDADLPLYEPFYDAGIAFVAGFGNHDWDPANFSDGPGYSVSGHLSNESTKAFTRETHRRSAQLNPQFRYREVGPTSDHGPVQFVSSFRGVDIVNFNSYLYQPSYRYPEGWPLTCNLLMGGAGCQTFVSAERQIEAVEALLPTDRTRPVIFTQHYPLTTGDGWWDDHGASGTTLAQRKERLLGLMDRSDHTILLAGHNHSPAIVDHRVGDRLLREVIAPYFGGDGGDDPARGGGFVAVLVSPTEGILETRTFPTGL